MYRFVLFLMCLVVPLSAKMQHGVSLFGDLKYGPDFAFFDTVNPDAPKGGDVKFGIQGTFDSLNPLILKGNPAAGVRELSLEGLVVRSPDEPMSVYGLLADGIEIAPDHSSVTYHINPKARFQDGTPVTAKDVLFSFFLQREKGTANRRMYYKRVEKLEALDPMTVRFAFKKKEDGTYDREMPVIIGFLAVLPEHVYKDIDFEKTGLKPLVGSGPYTITHVDAGRSVTYTRDPNYWGKDLPVNRGHFNFDKVTYDYYANATVLFEAFKAGNIDQREEIDAAKWRRDYDFKAVKDGKVTLANIPHEHQVGMRGFAMNTRRPIFQDPLTRRAMMYLFDFDWMNKNLFYGEYARTKSFFDNTELSSWGVPMAEVHKRLEKLEAPLPKLMYDKPYHWPDTGKGFRENLKEAKELLTSAGWRVKNGKLVHKETGEPFEFEILLNSPEHEKVALAYARSLKQAGITAHVRTVDAAQYEKRRSTKDFDMVMHMWGHTMSPGAEQGYYWNSSAADTDGTRNYPGVKSKAVDRAVDAIIGANSREELVAAVQTLDLLLLWGEYVIPMGHRTKDTVAYWNNRIDHPTFGVIGIPDVRTWWSVDKKE